MSVIVETANPYRCCQSCNSNDGVIEITALMCVGKTKQGTQIALCEACAQKLRFALNSRLDTVPERNGGEWIKMSDANGIYWACSVCGEELPRIMDYNPQFDLFPKLESIDKTRYCPNCGEPMRKEEMSE